MCNYQRLRLHFKLEAVSFQLPSKTREMDFVTHHCDGALKSNLPPNKYCADSTPVAPSQWDGKDKRSDRIHIIIHTEYELRCIDFEREQGQQHTLCRLLNVYAEKNRRLTGAAKDTEHPNTIPEPSRPPDHEAVALGAPPDVSGLAKCTTLRPSPAPGSAPQGHPKQIQRTLLPYSPNYARDRTCVLPSRASETPYQVFNEQCAGHTPLGAVEQQQDHSYPPQVLEPSWPGHEPSATIRQLSGLGSLGVLAQPLQRRTQSPASVAQQLPSLSDLGLLDSSIRPTRRNL